MTMDWEKLLNATRLGGRPRKDEKGRSPYNSDHDKIIFSGAFRRLGKKTQVHPLATNDHIHNRMTHSLEVSCVGRTLGMRVGDALIKSGHIPAEIDGTKFDSTDIGDIVQSACLAHDIGNPPFGHTGEEAIRSWFENNNNVERLELAPAHLSDLKCFEGNAQGLRVLTQSEYHQYDGGMRLTYATLGSFIKYPWDSEAAEVAGIAPKDRKYGYFQSEKLIFDEVVQETGLITRQAGFAVRHPLVYLMEAADDFCYGIIDLEDGLEMGIISWVDVEEALSGAVKDWRKFEKYSLGRKVSLLRGEIINTFIESGVRAFVENQDKFLRGEFVQANDPDSFNDLISLCDGTVRKAVQNSKDLAKEKIFQHARKIELEVGAYQVIGTLMDALCPAVIEFCETSDEKNLTYKASRVINLIGAETFPPDFRELPEKERNYLAIMRIIDFVSGMTDNYATYLAKQFNGMGDTRY